MEGRQKLVVVVGKSRIVQTSFRKGQTGNSWSSPKIRRNPGVPGHVHVPSHSLRGTSGRHHLLVCVVLFVVVPVPTVLPLVLLPHHPRLQDLRAALPLVGTRSAPESQVHICGKDGKSSDERVEGRRRRRCG